MFIIERKEVAGNEYSFNVNGFKKMKWASPFAFSEVSYPAMSDRRSLVEEKADLQK